MTKYKKLILAYLAIFLPITIITVTMRTVALFVGMDENNFYFTSSALPNIAVFITIAFVVFAVSYAFISDRNIRLAADFENHETYIPSGIVAVALFFMGTVLLGESVISFAGGNVASDVSSVLLPITAALAFASAINFFFNALYSKKESQLRGLFCLLCAIYLALYAGYLFFSHKLPLNAPNKALDQLTHLALSVFFLYETRISLGRPIWRFYISFGLIAANLAFFSAVPSLIYYLADGITVSADIAETVLVLTLGIYVTCRLMLTVRLVPDEICEVARAISEMSRKRSEEIKNSEHLGYQYNSDEENKARPSSTEEGSNYEMEIPDMSVGEDASFTQESLSFDDTISSDKEEN